MHCSYRERLDGPHNQVLLWDVFSMASARFELGRVSVAGDWNPHLHVVGHRLLLELSLRLGQDTTARRVSASWRTQAPYMLTVFINAFLYLFII